MKTRLIEILKNKELTLQEIYTAMPDIKQSNIRAILNLGVKKGILFERVSKGKYKLKE